jgi:hypothetical protein
MPKYHMPNWEDNERVKNEKQKKRKGHRRMNRRYLDSKSRCNRETSWYTRWKLRNRRWTDGPFSSSVGWVAEKKRRQQHRMIPRSIGGNRRSIRWSSLNKTETCQDERSSTGWTDGSAAVYLTVTKKPIEKCTRWIDALSVYCVGAVVSVDLQQLSDVEGTRWTNA